MYKIKLPNFEGPFDLLLFFIKRDEVNIYDIPISKIANEFLTYIKMIKEFDLELAGEFLVMASNLMYIKTQMLLPRETEDGEEAEDPRTQLVQRLLEYKQYKEASNDIEARYEDQKYTYYRDVFDVENNLVSQDEGYKNANMFDLMKAFNNVLGRLDKDEFQHVVEVTPISIDDKKIFILETLAKKTRTSFLELTKVVNRRHVVVTFLAILDLIKLQKIYIKQDNVFDDISIALRPLGN